MYQWCLSQGFPSRKLKLHSLVDSTSFPGQALSLCFYPLNQTCTLKPLSCVWFYGTPRHICTSLWRISLCCQRNDWREAGRALSMNSSHQQGETEETGWHGCVVGILQIQQDLLVIRCETSDNRAKSGPRDFAGPGRMEWALDPG